MENKIFEFMEKNNPYKVIAAVVLLVVFLIALINYKTAIGLVVGVSIVGLSMFLMTWVLIYNDRKNNW